jgi:hypothetical protein
MVHHTPFSATRQRAYASMKRRMGSNLSFAQDQFAMREMTILFLSDHLPSGPERLRGGTLFRLM